MEKITLDWDEYFAAAREAAAEGIVLLENNGALPLKKGAVVAVFGRVQNHYYKSGNGSGGMVNVAKVWSIPDGLRECGVKLNEELCKVYEDWERENPIDNGVGWGGEPWSQKEMPVSDKLARHIARHSDAAVCIIGRTAGEEQDASDKEGSYRLTDIELDMLKTVRKHFKEMTVLLNVSGIIDMSFVEAVKPDAVAYVWQGGMAGGLGAADVLTGKVSPSGKLADTIAKSIDDYPSAPYFGNTDHVYYKEDIYVGYRYFQTFAADKVLYPFGYGLSYTKFVFSGSEFGWSTDLVKDIDFNFYAAVTVTNVGSYPGKETVQLYAQAPAGKLGKPKWVLLGYAKTKLLDPGEEQKVIIHYELEQLASYDDSGVTGHPHCWVLEEGYYPLCLCTDIRNAKPENSRFFEEKVIRQCEQALAPVLPFKRMINDNGKIVFEDAPLMAYDEEKRRLDRLPKEIKQTGDRGIKLIDVKNGTHTMEEFIAQLSDDDLSCIIRGEGMGSPLVTAGTASAFGGVSERLRAFGIPCGCCDDGPSGMRLDCGNRAFSLPNGTMLACTFNPELVERLYSFTGIEVAANNVECLLGPGMNIHRHPLNGRNFEYFSEDPYLTGTIAAAQVRGLQKSGVTGTIKHFCGNNQETGRHVLDSVISERALREIYLKGFEIAIKEGGAKTVMTTYGSLNGLWTAGNYDLCTTILREEWGFDGFVMTDWWSDINERGKPQRRNNFAQMARAQNDVYMVCANSSENTSGDNTLSSLEDGSLTRGELQRNAANICRFVMNTYAMDRLNGVMPEIEIINRPSDDDELSGENVVFHELDGSVIIPLDGCDTRRGASYVFALDVKKYGTYSVAVTAKSDGSRTAQMPVTLFTMGYPAGMYTFNGTDGNWVSISRDVLFYSRFVTCRLYFGQSGLSVKEITFELKKE